MKWFINEDLGVYQYDPKTQAEDFPNDFTTPYDTWHEAYVAADVLDEKLMGGVDNEPVIC